MEGEHAQMWQIPCKMTNSSSKPLQTLGKWYQPRNPKKNPKPAEKKNPKTISHPYQNGDRGMEVPPTNPPSRHRGTSRSLPLINIRMANGPYAFARLANPRCAECDRDFMVISW